MHSRLNLFPAFRWTFSTLGCPERTLEECCTLAESYESLSIEARTLEETADLPQLFKKRFGTPDGLAHFMSQRHTSIDFLDTSLKLFGNDSESRAAFLEFVPWAEALDVRWLRVFDGGTVCETIEAGALDKAIETLDWWDKLRRANNWATDIAIETHDALVYSSARDQLFERANRPVKFIWDSHHTWKKSGDTIEQSWKQLKGRIVNIHIKDSVSKPSARHPFTYVQLGDGEFPLAETLSLIDSENYSGNVSIEWERQWHPYLPPIETALSRATELNWFNSKEYEQT